jgi:alkylation response protein AidB-like acyl-CoA dehydrogenase
MEADPLGYAPDLWRKMAELGWLSFALPPAYGGDGAPLTQLSLLVEEIGRAVAPVPFLSTLAPALTIAEAGTAAQCQDLGLDHGVGHPSDSCPRWKHLTH